MQIIPEIAVQNLIQVGMARLRADRPAFNEIFCYLIDHPFMKYRYGQEWIDKQWDWFNQTKIRVIQSYSLSSQTVPAYSIRASSEHEEEGLAVINDSFGIDEDGRERGIASFSAAITIGIHANKSSDQVMWMKRILFYILFKEKELARDFGLDLYSPSVGDISKQNDVIPENVNSLFVNLNMTYYNTWIQRDASGPYDVETGLILSNLKNEEVEFW